MLVTAPPQFKITPSIVGGQLNLGIPDGKWRHTYTVLHSSTLLNPTLLGWQYVTGNGNT